MIRSSILILILLVSLQSTLDAQETHSDEGALNTEQLRSAISRAIPLIEKGSAGSADERTCFTCHHQAMPILALSAAKRRGFKVDEENLSRQLQHTFKHLERGRKNYVEGKGQGGRVVTAGYALWALHAGGHPADEITSAVVKFLLRYQKDLDHWRQPGKRPPSSGSDFTATYVALRGLADYAPQDQRDSVKARSKVVREWLLKTEPKDTEDQVFRLRSMPLLDPDTGRLEEETQRLLKLQRDDGGWAQTPKLKSDAYATGSALVALMESSGYGTHDEAVQRGLKYLLRTQLDDGSWRVPTRAKGFQTYFETGFPHKKDQFISMAASSWATLALTHALSDKSRTTKGE